MTTYAVALSKGGSTKTTTAAEIAAALARRGRPTLAIDLDQQGNLTTRLGITQATEIAGTAADVLIGTADARHAAIDAPAVPGVRVLVGAHDLAEIEQRPEAITALRDYLPTLTEIDVVIDTPPALGILTLAALAAADVVIAPVACETEAVDQLDRLRDVISHRVAPRLRPGQRIDHIVPTRYDARRLLDREVVHHLNEHWPGMVTRPIREAVAARDAYTAGMPVSCYAPSADITRDYHEALSFIDQNPRHA